MPSSIEKKNPGSGMFAGATLNNPNFSNATFAADRAIVQLGISNTAKQVHKEGLDLATLMPLLTELLAEIGKLPYAEVKKIDPDVQVIEAEAAKDKPDANNLATAVDKVKLGVEAMGYGEKFTEICLKISAYIASQLP